MSSASAPLRCGAIRDGNAARAVRIAQDHLAVARTNTLANGADRTIEAKLIPDADQTFGAYRKDTGR